MPHRFSFLSSQKIVIGCVAMSVALTASLAQLDAKDKKSNAWQSKSEKSDKSDKSQSDVIIEPITKCLVEQTPPHLPNYQPERGRYALNDEKMWAKGTTITVAFFGGRLQDKMAIEKITRAWTDYGNVHFSFRNERGDFNEWCPNDKTYAADVRLRFDGPGYWSALGKDCINKEIFPPYIQSMNLDLDNCDLRDYEMTILHEFGHVLGFVHEHQRPDKSCNAEYRWEDDEGYVPTKDSDGMYVVDSLGRRPGIYTWCSGPPNKIARARVDKNMRSLPQSSAYDLGPIDRQSIMHYHFPAFFYNKGKNSRCYSQGRDGLTRLDIAGVKKAYPGKSR